MTSSEPSTSPPKPAWPTPVERDFDMRIDTEGRWYHEGGLIKRDGLVKLFASVLEVDADGQHWLRTPVEFGRIEVADAPFIITALSSQGQGAARILTMTDNLDRAHLVDAYHPILFRGAPDAPDSRDARPYLRLDGGLLARLSRPAWYELAGLADDSDDAGVPGLWSQGCFFVLQ